MPWGRRACVRGNEAGNALPIIMFVFNSTESVQLSLGLLYRTAKLAASCPRRYRDSIGFLLSAEAEKSTLRQRSGSQCQEVRTRIAEVVFHIGHTQGLHAAHGHLCEVHIVQVLNNLSSTCNYRLSHKITVALDEGMLAGCYSRH